MGDYSHTDTKSIQSVTSHKCGYWKLENLLDNVNSRFNIFRKFHLSKQLPLLHFTPPLPMNISKSCKGNHWITAHLTLKAVNYIRNICFTNDQGYVLFVIITIPSLPPSWLVTYYRICNMTSVTSGTGHVYPPEHTSSPPFCVEHCLSCCSFSFGHCIVCAPANYGFRLTPVLSSDFSDKFIVLDHELTYFVNHETEGKRWYPPNLSVWWSSLWITNLLSSELTFFN